MAASEDWVETVFDWEPPGPLADRVTPVHRFHSPLPEEVGQATVVILMSGSKRDARKYMSHWFRVAQRNNLLLVAPEFRKDTWHGRNDYQMGNVFVNGSDGDCHRRDSWSFSVIEPLFDVVTELTGCEASEYILWGHSAGGQFVHRFIQAVPEHRCRAALAANSGFFTVPDPEIAYPFGLGGTCLVDAPKDFFALPLIVVVGDEDNTLDGFNGAFLNGDEAHAQGHNRVERANHFMARSEALADEAGVPFRWRFVHVANMSHSPKAAALISEQLLFHGYDAPTMDAADYS